MYEHYTFQLWASMTWCLTWKQSRSQWFFFHGSLSLPFILKSISCKIILMDYESVWPKVWPENICKPFILKSISCKIILMDYESVWPKVWPENICRSLWPTFHGPMNFLYILKDIWCINKLYLWIMSQYDLITNVDHSNLYFSVQWFCLISWKIFHVYHTFRLSFSITRHSDLYFTVQWFTFYVEVYLLYKHHTFGLWVCMTWSLTSK